MSYRKIKLPDFGEKISVADDGSLKTPAMPIIPFIEGDGIGTDITPAMHKVVDAAVQKAYESERRIAWMEIYAGEKAAQVYAGDHFPDETLEAVRDFRVAIKGPLTTPVGGGFRSLNVSLRQQLDLYLCQRPVRWFRGVPSPMREPQHVDMVIFRENSEDIYAGIEWQADSEEVERVIHFLQEEMQVRKIRFPAHCGIGIKPVSRDGTFRLVRRALQYAVEHGLPTVTLVHKGNIMKYTEGAFKEWGYELAREEFGATPLNGGPWHSFPSANGGAEIVVKDVIADAMLQQVLLRPREYNAIATLNLNGDYLSDALAAQVGGIGIAPGANIGDEAAMFEATHGTAPKYAGQDKVNPSSLILSAEMMLRHLGWTEAAEKIVHGMEESISRGLVTYDLARLMEKPTELRCSEFAGAVIEHM